MQTLESRAKLHSALAKLSEIDPKEEDGGELARDRTRALLDALKIGVMSMRFAPCCS